MVRYRCPNKSCNWEIDDHDVIDIILEHEKEHKRNVKEEVRTEQVPCSYCNGKGYTEHMFIVDIDVSETNSG